MNSGDVLSFTCSPGILYVYTDEGPFADFTSDTIILTCEDGVLTAADGTITSGGDLVTGDVHTVSCY